MRCVCTWVRRQVKDGLFIGDELSSQDLEFVVANKVTHVINCAGRQVRRASLHRVAIPAAKT